MYPSIPTLLAFGLACFLGIHDDNFFFFFFSHWQKSATSENDYDQANTSVAFE